MAQETVNVRYMVACVLRGKPATAAQRPDQLGREAHA